MYVIPFADHVYVSHAVTVSDPDVELLIVRFNVAVESQPAVFVNVAVYVPLVVYVVAFADQVYESHAVTVSDPNVELLIVRFNVAVESQPAVFVNVAVYVPLVVYVVALADQVNASQAVTVSDPDVALLIVKSKDTIESHPFAEPPTIVCVAVLFEVVYVLPSIHVYESHAVITSVPVANVVIVRFKVAIESHPAAFVNVAVYVPLVVYVVALADQVYELHAVTVSDPEVELLIVRFNVAIESHPAAFVNVAVYVPLVVYVVAFADQVYELHAVTVSEPEVELLIVRFNVAIESHPAAFVNVAVYVPLVVYVVAFADQV